LNFILLLAGNFMDPSSIMLIFTPLIVSLGSALGVNLVHLGIVVTMNLEIGLISPPVGFNLYVGSSLSKLPLYEVIKATLPILLIMIITLFVITYLPSVTLFMPKILFGSA
jgi:C4-dicarboxylate transporter DctM subunit